jgi:hypothetical protein
MGIGVVLIVYFLTLGVLAIVCSVVLGVATVLYLKSSATSKKKPVAVAATLPFIWVAYAAVWFFVYFTVSDLVFHHDPMIGDGWYTNIGNGYAIDMIDVTDQGSFTPHQETQTD